MNSLNSNLPLLLLSTTSIPLLAAEPTPPPIINLDRITVSRALSLDPVWNAASTLNSLHLQPNLTQASQSPDSADLLRNVPGAAVVRNGPLTGILQIHGLQNERVRLLIDGMTLSPACPNHMDPPLHYASPSSLQNITVLAGITPVSVGGDSLAGTVLLDSTTPRFNTNQTWRAFGRAGATVRTANEGLGLSGQAGAANNAISTSWQGGWQTGNDYRFPGGRARDTSYDTQNHEVIAAARTPDSLWALNAGLVRTRDAGTPSLPMDMIEDDGWHAAFRHEGSYNFGQLDARVYHHETDHLMDNFSLRPPGPMRMSSPAESDDTGFRLGTAIPRDQHILGLGLEFHRNDFDAYQRNEITGMQQDTLHEADRNRLGGYAEWTAAWSDTWETRLGARADALWMNAQAVEQWFMPSASDAAAFNAANRSLDDLNFDATLGVRHHTAKWLSLEVAAARKNRAPSLLERYLWTPLSASAGQADGRTYLGNLDLDSETSHQIAGTADLHGKTWQLKVTPFYNWVSDYIQGTPIARLDPTRRPVLQFQNVDRAELYGIDASSRWEFLRGLAASGSLSYVRGRNCDTDDNLYRIAPLRGSLGLDGTLDAWNAGAEVVLAAEQDNVSAYNNEPATPGYVTLNFHVGYSLNQNVEIALRLDNALDEAYADHLSGVNRVTQSDVPVGARLPGIGRNLTLTVNLAF